MVYAQVIWLNSFPFDNGISKTQSLSSDGSYSDIVLTQHNIHQGLKLFGKAG